MLCVCTLQIHFCLKCYLLFEYSLKFCEYFTASHNNSVELWKQNISIYSVAVDDKFLHVTISADNENICMLILRSFQRKVIILRSKMYNKLSRSTFLLPIFFLTTDNINEIVIGQV